MGRGYMIYVLMFGCLAGGLWVILTLGAAARAPDDMSGRWTIEWDGPALQQDATTMTVAQSGRYWTVQFGQRKPMSLVLREDWRGAADGRTLKMHLDGQVWQMDLTGDIPLKQTLRIPEVKVELTGPSSRYLAIARRTGGSVADAGGHVADAR